MSSSENESQMEESSSDEEQENEYDGMNELMGNLAPYDYKPLNKPFHLQARKLKVLKMILLVTMLLVKTKTMSWDE